MNSYADCVRNSQDVGTMVVYFVMLFYNGMPLY